MADDLKTTRKYLYDWEREFLEFSFTNFRPNEITLNKESTIQTLGEGEREREREREREGRREREREGGREREERERLKYLTT